MPMPMPLLEASQTTVKHSVKFPPGRQLRDMVKEATRDAEGQSFLAIFPSVDVGLALAMHKADREIVFVHF